MKAWSRRSSAFIIFDRFHRAPHIQRKTEIFATFSHLIQMRVNNNQIKKLGHSSLMLH